VSSGLVFVGVQIHLSLLGFAVTNVFAGLLWIWIVVRLRRRQRALVVVTTARHAVAPLAIPRDAPRAIAAAP